MEKLLIVDIWLKDCPIFLQNYSDSIYRYCEKKGIKKVNQLLKHYYRGDLDIQNNNTKTQFDGFIDLLLFQYFGEYSSEILMILDKQISPSDIKDSYLSSNKEVWFRRLGFSPKQIEQFTKILDSKKIGVSIIHLLNCEYFPEKNQISRNIQNRIDLLQKMYLGFYQKKEEKKEEQIIFSLPDKEQSKEIGKIPLEDIGIFCTTTFASTIYKSCLREGHSTIKSFFDAYPFLYLELINRNDKMHLQGVAELILFQYFGKKSEKIADLLKQPFIIEKKERAYTLSVLTKEALFRLGFSSVHIRLIERQNLFVYRKGFRIIDFLIEEYKKKNYDPYKAGSAEATYFHIVSILVRHFNPEEERLQRIAYLKESYNFLMDKIFSLVKPAQEIQKELQTLQVAEMKFRKEMKE